MDEKNYLIEIYKVEADKYNKTRDIQWKQNLAIWTLWVLAIYSKENSQFGFMDSNWTLTILLAISLLTVHIFFVLAIQSSLRRSLDRMKNIVQHLLSTTDSRITWNKIEAPTANTIRIWSVLQIAVSAILLIVFLN